MPSLLIRPLDSLVIDGSDIEACLGLRCSSSPQCCHSSPPDSTFISNKGLAIDLDTSPPTTFSRIQSCCCCNGESSSQLVLSRCSIPPVGASNFAAVHIWVRGDFPSACCVGGANVLDDTDTWGARSWGSVAGFVNLNFVVDISALDWTSVFLNFRIGQGHSVPALGTGCNTLSKVDIFDVYIELNYAILPPPPYPPGINPPISPPGGKVAIFQLSGGNSLGCCCNC